MQAKRLHFIAPVLICVCILLDGDVDIVIEEDLVGNFVKDKTLTQIRESLKDIAEKIYGMLSDQ